MADQQAGWYPDPSGDTSKLRYWNGAQWTDDYSDAQQQAASSSAQPQVVIQETAYTDPIGGQTQVGQAYVQAPEQQTNGLAIASLICGIVGLCVFLPSIAAIITGVMGRKNPVNRGMATAGLVLGIIGIVEWIVMAIVYVLVLGAALYTYY